MELDCNYRPTHFYSRLTLRLCSTQRVLFVNNSVVYTFGSDEQFVRVAGVNFCGVVRGPIKNIWLDKIMFRINIDSPPNIVMIGESQHTLFYNSAKDILCVDGTTLCCFTTAVHYSILISEHQHELSLKQLSLSLQVNMSTYYIDQVGKYSSILVNRKPHGVMYTGSPQTVLIDNVSYVIPLDEGKQCLINGTYHYVA